MKDDKEFEVMPGVFVSKAPDLRKVSFRQQAEEMSRLTGDISEENIQNHIEWLKWESQRQQVTKVITYREKVCLVLGLVLILSGITSMLLFAITFADSFYQVAIPTISIGVVFGFLGLKDSNLRLKNLPPPPAIIFSLRRNSK